MSRQIVLAGYYGFGNTGDEAILTAILEGLTRRVPNLKVAVLSGDPDATRARHENLRGVDAIGWRDVPALSARIADSDAVVVGGGGLFQDYWGLDTSTLLTPRHGEIAFYAAPVVLAALARKPVLLYGLGFGPLFSPDAKRYARAVADAAVHISVRDEGSRDLLASTGVAAERIRVSADPAFALALTKDRKRAVDACNTSGVDPKGPIVGVAVRPWSIGAEQPAWESALVAGLDRFLAESGGTALFVPLEKSPWTDSDDFEQASRLAGSLASGRAAVLSPARPPEETAGLLASCDLVLGMRLHSLVFAAAGGVPAAGLVYDPKVSALLARLGAPEQALPLAGLSAESLAEALRRAHGEAPSRSERQASAARALRALAEEDLDHAARLIADPPPAPELTEHVAGLFADAVRANLGSAREIGGTLEALQSRLASLGQQQSRENEILERRLAETRQELSRLQASPVLRAVNVLRRAQRGAAGAARRLLGRPHSDWAGPDGAIEAARRALPVADDNRYDVVWLAAGPRASLSPRVRGYLEGYAAAGHRVFVGRTGMASSERAEETERAELVLPRDDAFAALDRLRRDESLAATALFVEDPELLAAARRLRRERAWLFVDATGERDLSNEPADLVLDPAASPEDVRAAVPRFFPKASIVVVTRDNLDLNRLCLESLRARTEWPNFEVVAVDNGSTDGTPELLADLARRWPALTVIANAENRGFAAATNQGFANADGTFLVMLNNDTVVTRGWLTALLRHLASDPKTGLVGPVSNAVSNEAQVDLGYQDLEDLESRAKRWTRDHDGQTFPIPMLAFFCTALRRETWEAVGPLDERFGIGMFEDDDYCRRIRARGLELRCARDAFVHHWQKATFRRLGEKAYRALYEENRRKYEEKWGSGNASVEPPPADIGRYRGQLQALLDRSAGARGVVVFLPSVGWGIHLFQRPHHLARAFARSGWIAVFDCSNAQDKVDGFQEIEPNLYLFRGPSDVLQRIPSPLLWSFPYNFEQTRKFPRGTSVVYDWIDDLSVFPYERRLLEENHEAALSQATVVAAVARRLHAEALERRPDAIYLPNGVEYERFAAPATPTTGDRDVEPFVAAGRPIAGYYGALAEWFDYELLEEAARLREDWSFLLVGPMYDRSLQGRPMLKRANVRWIGPRDYHLLPGYLALFDVATIPFRINPITTATSPLKLFEYFAGGKPVVTTPMPECAAFPEVSIAADARAFAAALDPARERGRDPVFRGRLRSLGRENSWDARVVSVLAALASVPAATREAEAADSRSPSV